MSQHLEPKTMSQKLIICTRCILPSTFPGTTFNEEGVCNHCLKYRGEKATEAIKKKYENKFIKLLKQQSNKSYDVLMAYSGGKDSTYTLDLFVNRYKLRVLALTFDNTFISHQSFVNMTTVCNNLGADHLIIRPSRQVLHKIFRTAAQQELFSTKTTERASTICTSCIGLVKAIILRTAIEKEIPFVGFGWSPGQAPVQSSVMKTNAALMQPTQKAIFEPLHKIVGDAILPYFVTEEQFSNPDKFPWNIHPLAFLNYNEGKIIARNNEIGWVKPDDTDPNSTNCLLNAYANKVHRDKYQFHPYVWEIANMVRAGVIEREEGIEKIYPPENQTMVDYAKDKLANQGKFI
jgi:tRNA(Ile)-lysidine synthase TilS/MesJ